MKKFTFALAVIAVLSAPVLSTPSSAHEKDTMSMSMMHTGDPDVDFATNMAKHHKMGLDMAEKELKDGKNPEMRAMAEKIKDAQTKEIDDMQAWLDKNKSKGKE